MADNEKDNSFYFDPIDVSEPRAPRREIDIIEEAIAIRRRDWIKTHMTYIYAVIGVIVVALIVFLIHMYYQNTNPLSRFVSSVSKDFGSSFHFEVRMTEDGQDMMRYTGSMDVDRSKHEVEALYDADYGRYTFTGAVYADDRNAMKGSLYDGKWTVHDCTDQVQDFFDFDRDFRSGGFDGGAFLRFTGLTSNYSTRELESFVGVLKNRLSTDSAIASITSSKVDGGTRYDYDIDLYELFGMIQENGASVFYRATDYDKFSASFDNNKGIIEDADCTVSFVVNAAGYMTSFDVTVVAGGAEYGLTCRMSDFGSAEVGVPQDFLKAAALTVVQE